MIARVYLVSYGESACHEACKKALEKEFPGETFDADVNHTIPGIRMHVSLPEGTPIDLIDPRIMECRSFARGFMACLSKVLE